MDGLSLRERNKQRVRARILSATSDLFGSQGYSQTTMDDIAERADISRGTLFNYFPTKDSLLEPFIKAVFQNRIHPNLTAYLETHPAALDALRFLFNHIDVDVLKVRGINYAIQEQFLKPRVQEPQQEFEEDPGFLESVVEILRYGQGRGEVRVDIALEKQARYIGSLYLSIFYSAVLRQGTTDYQLEIDTLLSFIRTGLEPT